MTADFIEKNKGLLRVYSIGLWVLGWLVLFSVGLYAVYLRTWIVHNYEKYEAMPQVIYAYLISALHIPGSILFGLIMLGIAQLITCLVDIEHNPGRILRHGHTILYLYAATTAVSGIAKCILPYTYGGAHSVSPLLVAGLSILAKTLVLVALGHIFKRIVVMIDEARTLV